MILPLKKSIFLLIFACFQVLLFFSFYTAYEFIVTALFLVFLLFYFHYFKLKIVVDSKVGLLWVSLIVFLLISAVFTHSFPLTLNTLIFYVATFCIFVFFRSLGASKIIKKSQFIATFLLVGLVLSAFFITFFSFPDIATFLPSVNIFTTKHGHSHFAVLLLILIPLAWWFVFSDTYKYFNYRQSILFLFYVLLVFTFGRFAILVSLFQLPFLYQIIGKKKIKNIYLYLAGFILVSMLVIIGIFSINFSEDCAVHEFRSQVCKPISGEIRPKYFKQALLSFKSYPLFGYGPGTFSLITKRFNVVVQHSSIYTHNVFLQMFAESGLFVGSIYFLLIFLLFKKMFVIVKDTKNKDSLNSFIFLGLVSLLLNALIDFDWNIFPVYQMVIIFIAVVLWDYKEKIPKNKDKTKVKYFIKETFFKYFWLFLVSVLIILGFTSVLTKVLIITHNESLAFKIFPYFYSQSGEFLTESNLLDEQKKLLYKLYKNHSKFIEDNIENSEMMERKVELYSELAIVNPWEFTNEDYHKILEQLGNYKILGEVSQEALVVLREAESQGISQSYENKSEISSYLHYSSINLVDNGELELAVNYYNSILPILYDVDDSDPEFHSLYKVYFSNTSPWSKHLLVFLQALYEENPDLLRKKLFKIQEMHELSVNNGYQDSAFISSDLAILAANIASNDLENGDFREAADMYVLAQKFDEYILNNILWDSSILPQEDKEKILFWTEMEEFPSNYFIKYSEIVARDHFPLLETMVKNGDKDAIIKWSNRITEIAPWLVDDQELRDLLK